MIAEAQFNRATLDCMTALRRRLKQELGVAIRLSEPDAAERMIECSRNSTAEDVRSLGDQLAAMLSPPPKLEAEVVMGQGAIASRQYQHRASRRVEEDAVHAPSGSVRIYRGQIIRQ